MIIDLVSHLPMYEALIPGAAKISAAFLSRQPDAAPCEVRQKEYALKEDAKRRFEVHFRTIDLMIASEGHEMIHLCPADRLSPAEELPNGADGCKMDGEPQGSSVLLEKGYFCAIFPGEAHMVGGKEKNQEGQITKWVVKVPSPEAFVLQH